MREVSFVVNITREKQKCTPTNKENGDSNDKLTILDYGSSNELRVFNV